jgi:hypothetical protein
MVPDIAVRDHDPHHHARRVASKSPAKSRPLTVECCEQRSARTGLHAPVWIDRQTHTIHSQLPCIRCE